MPLNVWAGAHTTGGGGRVRGAHTLGSSDLRKGEKGGVERGTHSKAVTHKGLEALGGQTAVSPLNYLPPPKNETN